MGRRFFHIVVRKAFRIHQTFRTGQHCVILRQVSGNIGKGVLDLADKLQDCHQVSITHRPAKYPVTAKYRSQHISPVHRRAKTHIADIGKAVPIHPRGPVRLHQPSGSFHTLRLFGKRTDNHKRGKPLLKKHPQLPVCLLDLFMEFF